MHDGGHDCCSQNHRGGGADHAGQPGRAAHRRADATGNPSAVARSVGTRHLDLFEPGSRRKPWQAPEALELTYSRTRFSTSPRSCD